LNPFAGDPLDVFLAETEALDRLHPRRIGLTLMRVGIAALPATLCCGIAPANIAAAIATAGVILCRPPLRVLPGALPGFLFAGWIGLSAVAAVLSERSALPAKSVGPMYTWVVGLIAACAFAHRPTARASLIALAATTGVSTLLELAQLAIGWKPEAVFHLSAEGKRWYKSSGFSTLNLTQGFVMCMAAVSLLAGRALMPARLGAASGAWTTAAVVLTGARGACIGLAAGVAGWLMGNGRRALLGAAAAALGILGLGVVYLAAFDQERLAATFSGKDGRWPIWRVSIAVMEEHPLVGSGGPEAFKADYTRLFPSVEPGVQNEFPEGAPHAHNSFLSFASRNGIPALILYLWLLAALVRGARPRGGPRGGWRLALGALCASVAMGMFEDIAGHAVPAFSLFVTLGLATAMTRHLAGEATETMGRP
jgi:O-antigen ligase